MDRAVRRGRHRDSGCGSTTHRRRSRLPRTVCAARARSWRRGSPQKASRRSRRRSRRMACGRQWAAARVSGIPRRCCLVQDEASQIIPELRQALARCVACSMRAPRRAARPSRSPRNAAEGTRSWSRRDVRTASRAAARRRHSTRCQRRQRARSCSLGASAPLPFRDERVRSRADRCAVLGPRHRATRSGHSLAASPGRSSDACAPTQLDLLRRVRAAGGAGRPIVYSTCSSEPEENEEVVAAFLANAPDFAVLPRRRADRCCALRSRVCDARMAICETDPDPGLEAFFGAVLGKRPDGTMRLAER